MVNGAPALLVWVGDTLVNVTTLDIEDGRVIRSYTVANPDKLTFLQSQLTQRATSP